jgi:voltage-gated potassium channel
MDKELGDKFIFNTKGINHKVDEGDILVVVGKNSDLEKFYRHVG